MSDEKKPGNQDPVPTPSNDILLSIDDNFSLIENRLGNGMGFVKAKYPILQNKVQIGLIFIESMSDKILISKNIIEPLVLSQDSPAPETADLLTWIKSKYIYIPNTCVVDNLEAAMDGLLHGNSIIFMDGSPKALALVTKKLESRAIGTPETEATMLASMDSLTENLDTNVSLILRRIPSANLYIKKFTAGKLSQTELLLISIKDICQTSMIEDVSNRIESIDTDIIDGIGSLAELIQDKPFSLFPKYRQTQRPDTIVRNLASGRFVILCSNSPFGMLAPITFWDNLKTMDDYADKPSTATYLRIIRLLAFALSILISPLYLAFVTYNHSIVPPSLAVNITKGREGVPFPSIVEILVMSVSITIIREAAQRIPGAVGYFVGSLAAVVIGQATVNAGYISGTALIVVAISEISSFAISSTTLLYASRLLNYFMILLSGFFGMFGVCNGVAIIIWHMLTLESFGVPYVYPLVPIDRNALRDVILRLPLTSLTKRQELIVKKNKFRRRKK